eukprot:s2359_g12.t1
MLRASCAARIARCQDSLRHVQPEAVRQWHSVVLSSFTSFSPEIPTSPPAKVSLTEVTQVLKIQCHCPACGQSFGSTHALHVHIGKAHPELQFRKERNTTLKNKRVDDFRKHSVCGRPQCRHCGKKFHGWPAFMGHFSQRACPILYQTHIISATMREECPESIGVSATTGEVEQAHSLPAQGAFAPGELTVEPAYPPPPTPLFHRPALQALANQGDLKLLAAAMADCQRSLSDVVSRGGPASAAAQGGGGRVCELRVLHEDASEGQPAASHNRASLAGDSQDLLDMDDEAGRPKRAAPATALGATPVPLTIGEQPAKYTRGEAKGDTKGDQRNEAGAAEANEQAAAAPAMGQLEQRLSPVARQAGGKPRSKDEEIAALRELVKALARLALRMEDSLAITMLDSEFVIFLQTSVTENPWSITDSLFKVASSWKSQKDSQPETLTQPLRSILFHAMVTGLQLQLAQMEENEQVRQRAQEMGLLESGDVYPYLQWSAEHKKHVKANLEPLEPYAHADVKVNVELMLRLSIFPNTISRFHALRRHTESLSSEVLYPSC